MLCPDAAAQRKRQETQLFVYNVGFSVVTTTAGALINKPRNEKVWPCVKRALWQGTLGGVLQFSGKKLTYQITRTDNLWWGWGSKLVHSAGVSICRNAIMNRPFGQYWLIDYGPAHINFFIENGHLSVRPQFNLLFLMDLYNSPKFGKFDLEKTLKLGTVAFKSKNPYFIINNIYASGLANPRSIVLSQNSENINKHVPAHELVHVYQHLEYSSMNLYFDPLTAKINNRTIKGIFKYVNVEFPFYSMTYNLVYRSNHFYRNIYEFEAQFFSTNAYVNRNQAFRSP